MSEEKEAIKIYAKDHIKYICGIDFGSFGCAVSWCRPNIPDKFYLLKQTDVEVSKDLSALLIQKGTDKVIASGYDAEEKYAKLQEDTKECDKYMYFQHFKPQLYKQLQGVTEENNSDNILENNVTKDKDIIGENPDHKMSLVKLITLSLQSLMEQTMKEINNARTLAKQEKIDIINVFWVITVPAIWDEMSMEIMKLCARKAGMIELELGMEPVTSTFYALNADKENIRISSGSKFIVLDCGGGTIDASCMKIVNINNDMSELYHGDGIMCGGLKVDQKFLEYFEELFPKDIILKGKVKKPGHWVKQRKEFVQSRWFVPYDLGLRTYNVSLAFTFATYVGKLDKTSRKNKKQARRQNKTEYDDPFGDLAKKILNWRPNNYNEYVKEFRKDKRYIDIIQKYNDNIEIENKNDDDDDEKNVIINYENVTNLGPLFKLSKGKLEVTQLGWDILHYDTVKEVSNFLGKLLKHPGVDAVRNVILVGGFAKSIFLRQRLATDHRNIKFSSSNQAQLAVCIGSLYWLCQSNQLSQHRSKWTYGIAIDRPFNQNFDDANRKKTVNTDDGGKKYLVYNAFDTLCEFNANLPDGHRKKFDYTIPPNREVIEIPIWVTKSKSKRYVLNDGPEPVIPVKKFTLKLTKSNKPRDFTITFEYKHNGVNLIYIDPSTLKEKKLEVKHSDIDILATDFKKNNQKAKP